MVIWTTIKVGQYLWSSFTTSLHELYYIQCFISWIQWFIFYMNYGKFIFRNSILKRLSSWIILLYFLCFNTISSIHKIRGVRYLAIFYHHYKFNDIDCGSHYLWLFLLDKIGFSNCLLSDNNKSKRPSFVTLWFALLH